MARSRKNPSLSLPLLVGGGVVAAGAVWYFFIREGDGGGLKYPGVTSPPTKSTFSPVTAGERAAAALALVSMTRDERVAMRRAAREA